MLSWIFISASPLKQQSRVDMSLHSDTLSWFRANPAPLWHIILIPSQPVFALSAPLGHIILIPSQPVLMLTYLVGRSNKYQFHSVWFETIGLYDTTKYQFQSIVW